MALVGIGTTSEVTVSVPVDEFSTSVKRTFMLLAQASDLISYQKRFSILQPSKGCMRSEVLFKRKSNPPPKKKMIAIYLERNSVHIYLKQRSQKRRPWKNSKPQLAHQVVQSFFKKAPRQYLYQKSV